MTTRPAVATASRALSPEIIAAALSVVVLVAVVSGLTGGPAGVVDDGSPRPSAPASPAVVTPAPRIDPGIAGLVRQLNLQIVDGGRSLESVLAADPFRTADAAATIRQINGRANLGSDALANLGDPPSDSDVVARMAAVYRSITETAEETLAAALTNADQYRIGAGVIVDVIAELPGIQEEFDRLEEVGVTPAPSADASPQPTATVAASPGTSDAPSAPPVGEQIEMGGFEEGVGSPWTFAIAPDARATIAADPERPLRGATSARIDVEAPSAAYSGISLRQGGIELVAGARYQVSIGSRAAAARDIRVRVASGVGAAYLTRVVSVGPTWTTQGFTFIAPVTDDQAVLEIDLGRSPATTWLDSISLARVGP